MNFKVLVVGLLPYDSGKTTLALGLIAGLRKLGYKTVPFKPISAHNWYTQYHATLVGMRHGVPISEDIIRLAEASKVNERFEILNPVDSITAPLNPGAFWDWHSPSMFYTYTNNFFRQILVSRISFIQNGRVLNYGFLNKSSIDRKLLIFDPEMLNKITRRFDKIEHIGSVKALTEILASNSMPAIENTLEYLKGRYKIIIIESFNDAAWPLPINEKVDLVIAVAPGQALIYDSKKYRLAVSLRENVVPSRGVVFGDIFDLLGSFNRVDIPPISYGSLPESIAEKLDNLIEIVVESIERKLF